MDSGVHLEQVSVDPRWAGRGIGRALIDHLVTSARAGGHRAITLTTYSEVAWNGPYYERYGFRYLDEEATTPGLRAIRAAEAAHGLERWPRACMRLDL